MNEWKLITDGDGFEQNYWPILKDKFPNYEIFWSEFVVPMTCRTELSKNHPLYIHPRKNVDTDLQNISMAHYTIFRSFIVVHELINLRQNGTNVAIYADRLDLIYSNFGTIIDMVSNIFFFINKLQFRFGLVKKFIDKKPYSELEQALKRFFESEYDKRIKEFEKTKRPISIEMHTKEDYLFEVLGRGKETESFNTFIQRIRRIRNIAIHNPVIGSVNGNLIPKYDKLNEYYFWDKLFYNLDNKNFIDKEQMFKEDFKNLAVKLNELWAMLIIKFKELSRQKDFNKLLGICEPFKECPSCKGKMQYKEIVKDYFYTGYDQKKRIFVSTSSSANQFRTEYWECDKCGYGEVINAIELRRT